MKIENYTFLHLKLDFSNTRLALLFTLLSRKFDTTYEV